jgi:hypothetical protein
MLHALRWSVENGVKSRCNSKSRRYIRIECNGLTKILPTRVILNCWG